MRTWLRPLILLNLVTLTNHALADSDANIGVLTGVPGRTGGNTVITSGGGETTYSHSMPIKF